MPETPQHRRARRTRIRRAVVGASLATFALAWGVIAGTGSMGASTATSASSATSGASAAAPSRTYDEQSDDGWGEAPQPQQQQQQQQSPDLTTRQS